MSPSLKAQHGEYGYRLTGQAGSLPYMAPEVVLCKTYDSKCDVFSFAILLWEILSLQQCCKGYTPEQFVDRISIRNQRFPIKKSWPPLTRLAIPEAWDPDPRKRPGTLLCLSRLMSWFSPGLQEYSCCVLNYFLYQI
jgi:serine/threonine protein kinase